MARVGGVNRDHVVGYFPSLAAEQERRSLCIFAMRQLWDRLPGKLRVGIVAAATVLLVVMLRGCGASALCRDGTYSFSSHHRGTCSWHGGVARFL